MGVDGTESNEGLQVGNFNALWDLNTWNWTSDTTVSPARISVASAGIHTFNIWMREDGTIIDRVLLTSDAAFVPTGTGPAEAGRSIVAPVITLRSVSSGNNLTLSWDGAGALQGSTTVTGVWNLVSTNSPVTTNTASGSSYFRLNVPLVP